MNAIFKSSLIPILIFNHLALHGQIREPVLLDSSVTITPPYNSTVYVSSIFSGVGYRSSGSVAWYENLIFTTAHNVYDSGRWATNVAFVRGWHSNYPPSAAQVTPVRGYRIHGSYAGLARSAGMNNPQTFSADLAVAFGLNGTNYGPPLPVNFDGSPVLRNPLHQKMIMGYPSRLDASGKPGGFFLHSLLPFTNPFGVVTGSYLSLKNFVTGSGNSGGPVVAQVGGAWQQVGVLVAGSRSSLGVYALDTPARNTALEALNAAGGPASPPSTPTPPTPMPPLQPTPAPTAAPQPTSPPHVPPPSGTITPPTPQPVKMVFANNTPLNLPDGTSTYLTQDINVNNLPSYLLSAEFSLLIETPNAGDIDAYLRAPSGRISFVAKNNIGNRSINLNLRNLNITSTHFGTNPNGTWRVFMRDFRRNNLRATYKNSQITVVSK